MKNYRNKYINAKKNYRINKYMLYLNRTSLNKSISKFSLFRHLFMLDIDVSLYANELFWFITSPVNLHSSVIGYRSFMLKKRIYRLSHARRAS